MSSVGYMQEVGTIKDEFLLIINTNCWEENQIKTQILLGRWKIEQIYSRTIFCLFRPTKATEENKSCWNDLKLDWQRRQRKRTWYGGRGGERRRIIVPKEICGFSFHLFAAEMAVKIVQEKTTLFRATINLIFAPLSDRRNLVFKLKFTIMLNPNCNFIIYEYFCLIYYPKYWLSD